MKTYEVVLMDKFGQSARTIIYATGYSELMRLVKMQFPNGRVISWTEKRN